MSVLAGPMSGVADSLGMFLSWLMVTFAVLIICNLYRSWIIGQLDVAYHFWRMYSGIPQAPWDGGFMAGVFINASALILFSWTCFIYLSVHPIHIYTLRFEDVPPSQFIPSHHIASLLQNYTPNELHTRAYHARHYPSPPCATNELPHDMTLDKCPIDPYRHHHHHHTIVRVSLHFHSSIRFPPSLYAFHLAC
jgi:hypothetical protein